MSWSLGEIRALAIKAARGAGFCWGLAEEAGFAVSWLQANGAPGVAALADYLVQIEKTGIHATKCPLHTGATISDGVLNAVERGEPVRQPLLLAPFIATAAKPETCRLIYGKTEALISTHGIETTLPLQALLIDESKWRICKTGQILQEMKRLSRVPESQAEHVSRLLNFAHKTYAPASEQSRLAGAGAGLDDND